MGQTILVIDDEPQIRRAVRNALEADGLQVVEAGSNAAGRDCAATLNPDLIILDLGLPDGDGSRLCREVRMWTHVPIIVLSARHGERDKVKLLDDGADDFITKPFSTEELRARVRANLRRAIRAPDGSTVVRTVDGLEVDIGMRSVRRGGNHIHLTPTEWSLLSAFVSHADRTLTHKQLFDLVWPQSKGNAQQYLRVYAANLRRKIEIDPIHPCVLLTEPGVGYKFQTD